MFTSSHFAVQFLLIFFVKRNVVDWDFIEIFGGISSMGARRWMGKSRCPPPPAPENQQFFYPCGWGIFSPLKSFFSIWECISFVLGPFFPLGKILFWMRPLPLTKISVDTHGLVAPYRGIVEKRAFCDN